MKRHKTHEHNAISERMCDEFNEARNVRELALIAHLYVEYFVNELIIGHFEAPGLVIDDGELGSFQSKITLLKALGVFRQSLHVLANVLLIQRIRNYYAHNLLLSDSVPDAVESRIRQLEYFEGGEVCEFDGPWSQHSLLSRFHACGIATTNGLIELQQDEQ